MLQSEASTKASKVLPTLTAPEHYLTIRSLNIRTKEGHEVLCCIARASDGIHLQTYDPSTGACTNSFKGPSLADSDGWKAAQYYSTIRAEVMRSQDGTEQVYVTARSAAGIHVYSCDPNTGKCVEHPYGPSLADAFGWAAPQYYSTIRTQVYQDKNGQQKLFVMIRSMTGIELHCYEPFTQKWTQCAYGPEWADKAGWAAPQYHSTIQTVMMRDKDEQEHLCILARSAAGIELHSYDPINNKWSIHPSGPQWSDKGGWINAPFYSTIRSQMIRNSVGQDQLFVLSRSSTQVNMWSYNFCTQTWCQEPFGPLWSDEDWATHECYSTIQTKAFRTVNGQNQLVLAGRSKAGVQLHTYDPRNKQWSMIPDGPTWTNEAGWFLPQYYSTVQLHVLSSSIEGSKISLLSQTASGFEVYTHKPIRTLSDLFRELNFVQFEEIHKRKIDFRMSTTEELYELLLNCLDGIAHVIHPDFASIFSVFDSSDAKAKTAIFNYGETIGGYFDNDNVMHRTGLIHQDGGTLKKPTVMLLNTSSIETDSAVDGSVVGGSHWVQSVIIPKNYITPFKVALNNPTELVFCVDPFFSSVALPLAFQRMLTHGIIHEWTTTEGVNFKHTVPPILPNAKFVTNPLFKLQQTSTLDCGWLSTYVGLMLIFTGSAEFLAQFKEASKEVGHKLRHIFSKVTTSLSHTVPVPRLGTASLALSFSPSLAGLPIVLGAVHLPDLLLELSVKIKNKEKTDDIMSQIVAILKYTTSLDQPIRDKVAGILQNLPPIALRDDLNRIFANHLVPSVPALTFSAGAALVPQSLPLTIAQPIGGPPVNGIPTATTL